MWGCEWCQVNHRSFYSPRSAYAGSARVFLCTATRGQYLALSKAWLYLTMSTRGCGWLQEVEARRRQLPTLDAVEPRQARRPTRWHYRLPPNTESPAGRLSRSLPVSRHGRAHFWHHRHHQQRRDLTRRLSLMCLWRAGLSLLSAAVSSSTRLLMPQTSSFQSINQSIRFIALNHINTYNKLN